MRDVDAGHSEKEPLLFNSACCVHLNGFLFTLWVCAKSVELLKAKQPRASEVSHRIHTLEPDIDPLLGQSIIKRLIRLESIPQVHEFFLVLLVLFGVFADSAPSFFDFVIESDPVYKTVASIEADRGVVDATYAEKLIDTDTGWGS